MGKKKKITNYSTSAGVYFCTTFLQNDQSLTLLANASIKQLCTLINFKTGRQYHQC